MALCAAPAIPLLGLVLQLLVLSNHLADCYYPGLRRKPLQQSLQPFDISPDFLAKLMEDNARRRLTQQFEQQLALIQLQRPAEDNQNGMEGAQFFYKFPPHNNDPSQGDGFIPFAVDPSDHRFYEEIPKLEDDEGFFVEEEEKQQPIQKPAAPVEPKPNNNQTYHRVKPMKPVQNLASNGRGREGGIEKQDGDEKVGAIVNTPSRGHDEHVVVRQHMGIDGEMGMWLVALIAGISAAVTVGLIALGIAWYTLQKKTKAAADVEYPAYGVTGPNKDISPSGDRRLAQSAQMYHYQHQKQQIIAMENRQAAESHGGLSDVESDDDNEEGDYTVYECPGLAPTGEMEVKNPLFLDDTPVTPSTGNPASNQQQPPQQQTQSPQKQPPRKPPKTPPATTGAPPTSTTTTTTVTPAAQSEEMKKGEK